MSDTIKVGRNEPCPCGSGEKYKFCCETSDEAAPLARTSPLLIGGVLLACGALAFLAVRAYLAPEPAPAGAVSAGPMGGPAGGPAVGGPVAFPTPLGSDPGSAGGAFPTLPVTTTADASTGAMPPAGAPPGGMPAPGTLTPQPPGPAPAGKVWSPEHGHWHDAPGAVPGAMAVDPATATMPDPSGAMTVSPTPGTLTPQPPGPAPEGKVWSPEHGHWHDAPGATPSLTPVDPSAMPVMPSQPMPGTVTPQPPGPAPAGKVWSPEHGHWHDDPAAAPAPPQ